MTQEKRVQSKLLAFLNSKDISPYCWSVKTIASNKNGVPDVIVCLLGHFVSFECKSETGKETKLQIFNRKKINKARGTSFVVKPSNLEVTKRSVQLFILTNKPKYMKGLRENNDNLD